MEVRYLAALALSFVGPIDRSRKKYAFVEMRVFASFTARGGLLLELLAKGK